MNETTTQTDATLTIGEIIDGTGRRAVTWDPRVAAHLQISGALGSGKTVLCEVLEVAAEARDWRTVRTSSVTDLRAVQDLVTDTHGEMNRRLADLVALEFGDGTPQSTTRHVPLLLLLDEVVQRLVEHKAEHTLGLIRSLTSRGREVQVYVVLTLVDHTPEAPPILGNELTARLTMNRLVAAAWNGYGSGAAHPDVYAAVAQLRPGGPVETPVIVHRPDLHERTDPAAAGGRRVQPSSRRDIPNDSI